jgi:hypothetical protein
MIVIARSESHKYMAVNCVPCGDATKNSARTIDVNNVVIDYQSKRQKNIVNAETCMTCKRRWRNKTHNATIDARRKRKCGKWCTHCD